MTYHQVNECGHSGAGLTINGVNYPIDAEFAGNASSLSPTIFAAASPTYLGFGFNSYATVHTPFLGTTLSVAPYSNNVCWAFLVGGSGNFTPPPPPVCTSCPITGWSNTVTLPGNNNGTPCNPADDYTTASIRVNHLSCASITGTKSFKVIYDPSGANISYGPFNYNTGVTTDVSISIPYGASNSTMVEVIDAAFPCQVTHGLSIPNGQYLGEKDLVPPTISSPGPITVNNDPGICGASVAYTVNYSDNCGVPTIQQTAGLPSGSVFPVGTTTNSFIVTDAAGNTASASFTVTVKDNEAPVPTTSTTGSKTISVPYGNTNGWSPWIFNFSDPLPAGAVVTGASLSYTAVDQGWGGTGDYDHMYVSGTHIGDNQLFHYAQSFTINYNGSIPGYNYGGNNTLQMNFTGYPGWVGYFRGGTLTINYQINALPAVKAECAATITAPTAKDNCSGMVTGTTSDPLTYNNQGTYTIHWTYQDASGNTATQTQAVIIKDVTPPVITTAPGSMDATVECSDAASLAAALALAPVATDNCSTATIHLLSDVKTAGCGSSYKQVRTWNFTDASGNTSVNNFIQTITVLDRTAPVLSAAPANITVDCNAVPVAATLTATDNCDASPVVVFAETSTQNGDINNAGHYNYTITRTWTAKDACGNTSSAVQVITVHDITAPTLTTPSAINAVNDKGICGAAINFAATASDICGPVVITYSQNPGTVFPVGVTIVNVTATDVSGNVSSGTFTIVVADTENPTITAPANISVNNDAGKCGAMVNLGTPVTNDNCGVAGVVNNAPAFFPVGTTTVTWTVTDIHGNTNSVSQSITVTDNEKPTISTVNISVNNDPGKCSATVSLGTPLTKDNCGVQRVVNDHPSATYPVGTTIVTWTVTDIHGNTNSTVQTVVVTDNEAPVIACAGNQVFCANTGGNTNYTIPVLSQGDNCGIASTLYTVTGATTRNGAGIDVSGVFNIGTSTVSYTVMDIHGNVSTCSFTVKVNPLPVASIAPSNADAFCNKLTLTGSSTLNGPFGYQWLYSTGSFAATQQISLGLTNGDGVYSLYTTDGNGCRSEFAATYMYAKETLASSYTILAGRQVELSDHNIVSGGSVGVMSARGRAKFGEKTTVASAGAFVKAPRIDAESGVVINQKIYGVAAVGLPTMVYNTTSTRGLPNFTVRKNTTATVSGNYKEVNIGQGAVVTLGGTVFGSIEIGQGATVLFTSPVINIGRLHVSGGSSAGAYTNVRFAGNSQVLVSNGVEIGKKSKINADRYKVTFYVGQKLLVEEDHQHAGEENHQFEGGDAGDGGGYFTVHGGEEGNDHGSDDGYRGEQGEDHQDGRGTRKTDTWVNANVYAPNGQLEVQGNRDSTHMTGLFIAQEIQSEKRNVIWNSYDCSVGPVVTASATGDNTTLTQTANEDKVKVSSEESELKVTVAPNPTSTYFTLKIQSRYETPVNLRVMDASGRAIEARSGLHSNSSLQVGENYQSGTYFAEFIQGSKRKVVQLIKARK
ncbi:HYR domain-containing protein [Asinibacterium sp. OR53]|uniref:HYR domain-containing protein n=1 Tax=Asinibacterium sp. OR53 TaxID=925409 RepID=UPI00047A035E|nr:HYR domain-containing protein [Asinibacterium sp. OR53]